MAHIPTYIFVRLFVFLAVLNGAFGQTAEIRTGAPSVKIPAELTRVYEQIRSLQAEVQRLPNDAPLRMRLAEAQFKAGQFNEAEAAIRYYLRTKPNDVPAMLILGRLLRAQFRFEEALEISARITKRSPRHRSGRLFAASLALDRLDLPGAALIFKQLLKLNPNEVEAMYGLAQVDYLENRYSEAERLLERSLKIEPKHTPSWLLKAQLHRIRQENAEFAASVRKAVESDPLNDSARAVLATILFREEKKPSAGHDELRLALMLNRYSSAHTYIGNGWTERIYPEIAVPRDPKRKDELLAHVKRGDDLLSAQRLTEADAAFSEALKLMPDYIPALNGKGAVQYYRKDYDAAMEWYFKVLEIDPDYGLAHYGISMCLARKKDAINIRLPEIERKFAADDEPEPPALRDVFRNYASLDPEMQKIVRISVRPLKAYLPLLKEKQASYYIFPIHHFLWQVPYNESLKGTRTFDGRLWDDVKGNGGQHATAGAEWQRDVKYLRYNVLTHEFTHQVHAFLPKELKDEIRRLYLAAKEKRLTLDFYADSNELEYFAQGVEAYVSEEKLPDQKVTSGHTRRELQRRDPALYAFIDKLAGSGRP